jgi:hypothetical protein
MQDERGPEQPFDRSLVRMVAQYLHNAHRLVGEYVAAGKGGSSADG